jgi:hypothetical protein
MGERGEHWHLRTPCVRPKWGPDSILGEARGPRPSEGSDGGTTGTKPVFEPTAMCAEFENPCRYPM